MAPVEPMTTENTFQKDHGDTALREHTVSTPKQKAKKAKKPMRKRIVGKHKS